MQPKNPNNELSNGHVFVAGMSGSGKTYLTKKVIIQERDQVIGFDPLGDYSRLCGRAKPRIYHDLKTFAAAALAARKTKQGFKIFWQPKHDTTWEDLDAFCRIAWALGDGLKPPLKVICEELAEYSKSTQQTTPYHRKLLLTGRKFNHHVINVFQRGQDVSKTIIDNCGTCFVMMQKTKTSSVYLERMTGIDAGLIDALEEKQYIKQTGKRYTQGKI